MWGLVDINIAIGERAGKSSRHEKAIQASCLLEKERGKVWGELVFRLWGNREWMEWARERYKRALRHRVEEELEESRAKFWINIYAERNKAKMCELESNRYVKESWRDR